MPPLAVQPVGRVSMDEVIADNPQHILPLDSS